MSDIRVKERSVTIFAILAIVSCLFCFTADNASSAPKYGKPDSKGNNRPDDPGMNEAAKRHLPWHGSRHATLDKPVLIAPEGNITTRHPLYQWQPVEGANRYGIIVYRITRSRIPVFVKFNIRDTQVSHP